MATNWHAPPKPSKARANRPPREPRPSMLCIGGPAPTSNPQPTCPARSTRMEESMLWMIVAILLIMWFLGIGFHIAGGLVHILLVIALVVIIFNLLSGRRALG